MPTPKIKRIIFARDAGLCWHCGSTETTIHHRKNRGMGGRKASISDLPSNLLTMCPQHNSLMESDANAYREAIDKGWKLRGTTSPTITPVTLFDGSVWLLSDDGSKVLLER